MVDEVAHRFHASEVHLLSSIIVYHPLHNHRAGAELGPVGDDPVVLVVEIASAEIMDDALTGFPILLLGRLVALHHPGRIDSQPVAVAGKEHGSDPVRLHPRLGTESGVVDLAVGDITLSCRALALV